MTPHPPASRRAPRRRAGLTLVEVLVGILLLSIIAVGTAAYLYHARATMETVNRRKAATQLAAARLEQLRATPYDLFAIAMGAPSFDWRYLSNRADRVWAVYGSDPGEVLRVGSTDYPLTTRVRYRDRNGAGTTFDYLEFDVEVSYRPGVASSAVNVRSYFAPSVFVVAP